MGAKHIEQHLDEEKPEGAENESGEQVHDQTVSSVSITQNGELDLNLIQEWISTILQEKGTDIFRMKGVLNIMHAEQRFVYQAVHMIFNGNFTEAWGEDEPRENKLVFIGKNLDAAELRAKFAECIATPEKIKEKEARLRFKIGDAVEC